MTDARIFKLSDGVDYMSGYVWNHPNLPSGSYVRTSPVMQVKENNVETMNTLYTVVWKKGYEKKGGL